LRAFVQLGVQGDEFAAVMGELFDKKLSVHAACQPIPEEHHNRIRATVSYEFTNAIKARSLQVAHQTKRRLRSLLLSGSRSRPTTGVVRATDRLGCIRVRAASRR
jgi:hypothetical protein